MLAQSITGAAEAMKAFRYVRATTLSDTLLCIKCRTRGQGIPQAAQVDMSSGLVENYAGGTVASERRPTGTWQAVQHFSLV